MLEKPGRCLCHKKYDKIYSMLRIDSLKEWQDGKYFRVEMKVYAGDNQLYMLNDRVEGPRDKHEMLERCKNSCRVLKTFGSFEAFQKHPWSWDVHKKVMATELSEWDEFFKRRRVLESTAISV